MYLIVQHRQIKRKRKITRNCFFICSFISLPFMALSCLFVFCLCSFLHFFFCEDLKRRSLNNQVIFTSYDLMHYFDSRFYDYSVFCTYLTAPPGTHLRPSHRFDLPPRTFAATMTTNENYI